MLVRELVEEGWKPRGAARLALLWLSAPLPKAATAGLAKKYPKKEDSRNRRQKGPLCFEEGNEEACTSHFLLSFLQTILPNPNPAGRLVALGKKHIPFLAQLA